MFTFQLLEDSPRREPWNKGKLVGQRRPLKPKEIWGIRIRLQMEGNIRDLALLNLAIDSKLRGCDLVRLRVADVTHSGRVMSRANVMQRKTGQPVQFEITEETQESISAWIGMPASTHPVICFQAESELHRTFRLASIPGSLKNGLRASALIHLSTEPIQCEEPRQP